MTLRAELRQGGPRAALMRSGEVADLGIGGAYIVGPHPVEEGARIWLRFVAPTAWEPLELEAEVRWVEAEGFGVRFVQVSEGEAAALQALVDLAGFEPA